MSDPAVNAQLDGIISDFEGGCRPATAPQACSGAPRGGPQARRGRRRGGRTPMGCPPAAPPPRARVASVEHPVRGTRGPRALAGPCARPARCRRVSFLLLLFVFAERRQSPRGLAGLPQTALARGFPLSCRSVLSLPRSPSASGPWPCGGLGEFATRPRVPPAGQPPPPHQFRSRG